jgi:hypothetical protein
LSVIVTPATLGVASKSNETSFSALVYRPAISNFDLETNKVYSPREGVPGDLVRTLNILASTGEILRLDPPLGLRNVSYKLDIIIPIVRCLPSNETIRNWTAASAFEEVARDEGLVSGFKHQYTQNLAFEAPETDFDTNRPTTSLVRGMIGYYGMLGNTSVTPNRSSPADLWVAVTTPTNASRADNRMIYDLDLNINETLALYSTNYFTCTLRNASAITNISFVDNVQAVRVEQLQEVDFNSSDADSVSGSDDSPMYAFDNYDVYMGLLYEHLTGFVADYGVINSSFGWNWTTSIDQTVFRTADDFHAMTAAWKDGGLDPGQLAQNKSLPTLIEEFSLNASLSLMSLKPYW